MTVRLSAPMTALIAHTQIFGSEKNDSPKIKDFGNISSSRNNSVDLIDDLYDAKFPFTINLPLNIASAEATTKDQATHVELLKQVEEACACH